MENASMPTINTGACIWEDGCSSRGRTYRVLLPRPTRRRSPSEGDQIGSGLLPGDPELPHEVAAGYTPALAGDAQCGLAPQRQAVAIMEYAHRELRPIGPGRTGLGVASCKVAVEVQLLGPHPATALIDHVLLEHNLELLHAAGPVMALQARECLRGHAGHRPPFGLVEELPEVRPAEGCPLDVGGGAAP